MSDSRPISRASAPQETSSKQTGKVVARVSSAEPQGPYPSNQLPAPASHHPALTSLARVLGRQIAREASREEGCDD